jgi:SNF2 family DNA or RNA helicase
MKRVPSFNLKPRSTPYPHQLEAVAFLSERDYAALFDEQGLGKTKIIIGATCQGIADEAVQGALIVCTKSLLGTWQDEVAKHSYLKSIQLRGGSRARGIRFMWFSHFYLVTYETLIWEQQRVRELHCERTPGHLNAGAFFGRWGFARSYSPRVLCQVSHRKAATQAVHDRPMRP